MNLKKFSSLFLLFALFVPIFVHSGGGYWKNVQLDPTDEVPKLTKAEEILFGTWDLRNRDRHKPDTHFVFVHPLQELMTSQATVSVNNLEYDKIYKKTMIIIAAKKALLMDASVPFSYSQEDKNAALDLLQKIEKRLRTNFVKTDLLEIILCCPNCPTDVLNILTGKVEQIERHTLIPQRDIITCMQFLKVYRDHHTGQMSIYFNNEKIDIFCKTLEGLIKTHDVLNQAHDEGWIRFTDIADSNKVSFFTTGSLYQNDAKEEFFLPFRKAHNLLNSADGNFFTHDGKRIIFQYGNNQ